MILASPLYRLPVRDGVVLPVRGPLSTDTTEREILAVLSTRRHSYCVMDRVPSSEPPLLRDPQPDRVIRVSTGEPSSLLLYRDADGWAWSTHDGRERTYGRPESWEALGDVLPRPGRGYADDCTRRLRALHALSDVVA